jgi:hypothetical protein
VAQRNSGYNRQEADNYATPAWCTRALLPHIPDRIRAIWEPAAGEGAMATALRERPKTTVIATDIRPGNGMPTHSRSIDFLDLSAAGAPCHLWTFQGICSNPPFQLAQRFIERALDLTAPSKGFVAMLLRTDYDHAKSRRHLFADNPAFAKRIVLTKRIVWFVDPLTGKPKASPSENHSWFLFDHTNGGPAQIAYYLEDTHAGKIDRQRLQAKNRQEDRQDHAREGPQGRPGETRCLHATEENGIE